jgi:hypothetical protein
MEVIDELINMDSNDDIEDACSKVYKVYGEQSPEIYKDLLEQSRGKNNAVYYFIRDLLKDVNVYAEIPSWCKNIYFTGEIPTQLQVAEMFFENDTVKNLNKKTYDLPSDEDIINTILNVMSQTGYNINDLRKKQHELKKSLLTMSIKQKYNLISPLLDIDYKTSLESDIFLFRILGPVHPLHDSDIEDLKYGGWRMFQIHPSDTDEQGRPIDWFTGSCVQCLKKIRRRYHSVRRPAFRGGWSGCYCSWNCVRQWLIEYDNNASSTHDTLLIASFIEIFDIKINQYGIQDQIPSENTYSQFQNPSDNILIDSQGNSISIKEYEHIINNNPYIYYGADDLKTNFFDKIKNDQQLQKQYHNKKLIFNILYSPVKDNKDYSIETSSYSKYSPDTQFTTSIIESSFIDDAIIIQPSTKNISSQPESFSYAKFNPPDITPYPQPSTNLPLTYTKKETQTQTQTQTETETQIETETIDISTGYKWILIESKYDLEFMLNNMSSYILGILYFSMKGCSNCQKTSDILEQNIDDNKIVFEVDIDSYDGPLIFDEMGVTGTPTIFFYRDGNPIGNIIGYNKNLLIDNLKNL